MTELERLARVAREVVRKADDADCTIGVECSKSIVRAVLTALRDPSEGTEVAAMAAFADPTHRNWDKLPAVWKSMIDHILSEGA